MASLYVAESACQNSSLSALKLISLFRRHAKFSGLRQSPILPRFSMTSRIVLAMLFLMILFAAAFLGYHFLHVKLMSSKNFSHLMLRRFSLTGLFFSQTPSILLQYHTWTAAMFSFFTSCFTIFFPHCLPTLCMTPEDNMWSSITWLTVWATCQWCVLTHISCSSLLYTLPYAYIWTFMAMSACAWMLYDIVLSWIIIPTQACIMMYSHRSVITILSFTYLCFY